MKKFLILSIVFVLVVALTSLLPQTVTAQLSKFIPSANGVAGRYIVVLNEKFVGEMAVELTVRSEAEYLQSLYGGDIKGIYSNAFKGFVVEMSDREAVALSRNERVAFVEQDAETFVSSSEPAASWGLDRIDQRGLPLDSRYSWGTDASNVHVYVIDTGIRPTHADFGGRATADYDALTDGQNGVDCSGHGTHVAGTVGSATYGVAKNVRLHGVRVLPCSGNGLVSHLLMGIDWVTANSIWPAVANISITISSTSPVTDNAIQNGVNSGVTFVVAAGNSDQDACLFSPGAASAAISVGATVTNDAKASYSNWGSCVDIWAPGSSIVSTGHSSDTASRVMSGTSMASAHVAGVVALYLAIYPNASPSTVANNLYDTSTLGAVGGLDGASPNRLVYSWLDGSAPTPNPARVTIKKRTIPSGSESTPNTAFPYTADNLSSAAFSLFSENQFVDSNVNAFGSGNLITVTETMVIGWRLTSISCLETSGSGQPNTLNTSVDLTNRTANIIVEEGEYVECTFTSEALAPSAAGASISGRITTGNGRGVKGARIDLLNASTNEVRYETTNTFGYYSFNGVPVGDLYVMSVPATRKGGHRTPMSQTFTLEDNISELNFVLE